MVAPRKTSSETIRPGRAKSVGAAAFVAGAEVAAEVAMVKPSDGRDSTAGQGLPQRHTVTRACKKKRPGGGDTAAFIARGKKLS
jgi:hypothetical protein